ncbi:MAG: flagellar assembly protein FliH [Clostridiales bacterium]|nr:flagellar assembly protein FliH [Clostridiales bacterium]
MSKVVKSFQVNLGIPFKINYPIDNFDQTKEDHLDMEISHEKTRQQLVDDAHCEANKIIQHAKQMAQKILNDANQEAEQLRQLALHEGREQGYKDGLEEIRKKEETILKEAREIKMSAQGEYMMLLESAEKDIIGLVTDIVKKIIGDELNARPEAISSIVQQTLHKCRGIESIIIKVSPEDYDIVNENKNAILRQSEYSGQAEVKKDLSLKKGDCIVETPVGSINAKIDTQLKAIEEVFKDILRQGNE